MGFSTGYFVIGGLSVEVLSTEGFVHAGFVQ